MFLWGSIQCGWHYRFSSSLASFLIISFQKTIDRERERLGGRAGGGGPGAAAWEGGAAEGSVDSAEEAQEGEGQVVVGDAEL